MPISIESWFKITPHIASSEIFTMVKNNSKLKYLRKITQCPFPRESQIKPYFLRYLKIYSTSTMIVINLCQNRKLRKIFLQIYQDLPCNDVRDLQPMISSNSRNADVGIYLEIPLKQWAAVKIQFADIMVPPQMGVVSSVCAIATCHGQEPSMASFPPTIRGSFRKCLQGSVKATETKFQFRYSTSC